MKEFTYEIKDPNGIHARPAGDVVKLLKGFTSSATIVKGDRSADMSKLFKLMGLGVKQGDAVTVKIEGEDENECAEALTKFFEENL